MKKSQHRLSTAWQLTHKQQLKRSITQARLVVQRCTVIFDEEASEEDVGETETENGKEVMPGIVSPGIQGVGSDLYTVSKGTTGRNTTAGLMRNVRVPYPRSLLRHCVKSMENTPDNINIKAVCAMPVAARRLTITDDLTSGSSVRPVQHLPVKG